MNLVQSTATSLELPRDRLRHLLAVGGARFDALWGGDAQPSQVEAVKLCWLALAYLQEHDLNFVEMDWPKLLEAREKRPPAQKKARRDEASERLANINFSRR